MCVAIADIVWFLQYFRTEIGRYLIKHGDAVKDIAFQVEDCDFLVKVIEMYGFIIFFNRFQCNWT